MSEQASKLTHTLGSLTEEERNRLGWILMWCIDGPEQGFITRDGVNELLVELHRFMAKNGVSVGGQAVDMALREQREKREPLPAEPEPSSRWFPGPLMLAIGEAALDRGVNPARIVYDSKLSVSLKEPWGEADGPFLEAVTEILKQ